jgi:hypothetical protein
MKLFVPIFALLSQLSFAASFCIVNEGFSGAITTMNKVHGRVQLRDFRVRIIADHLYAKSKDCIHSYINKYHWLIERNVVPPLLTKSNFTEIFGMKNPTTKLTMLLTADAYKDGEYLEKYFLYAEDLIIADAINCGDTLRVELKQLSKKGTSFKMDFSLLVDRDDNKEFIPLNMNRSRYMSLSTKND